MLYYSAPSNDCITLLMDVYDRVERIHDYQTYHLLFCRFTLPISCKSVVHPRAKKFVFVETHFVILSGTNESSCCLELALKGGRGSFSKSGKRKKKWKSYTTFYVPVGTSPRGQLSRASGHDKQNVKE